ncbi:tetratricopeptide repeat protein [Actinomadura sp. LOL_016]|uniref:WD40 repeat domain-containing protein n=1 Tax=unclassified Actinomadura TaxID=2626254 RepID=UPI003A800BED
MSTDLYGARVLDVAPGEARARFRIFVVYYDVASRDHAPLPDDDVGFFFRLLWEAAHDRPITRWHALQAVPLDDFLEPDWVDANAHRYVTRVERVASLNHPVGDDGWDGLHDFYYERDGGWAGEERLVQADYDVHVTDPRWLDSLEAGYSWGTTVYVSEADQVTEADAPAVVDLRRAARVLDPFPGGERDETTPSDLAFSDDGEYLAVTSQDCELVVYRTADWTEHTRIPHDGRVPWGQDIQWVPETRLLTKRVLERSSEPPTTAYDVDAGALVDVPPQPGEARSRTGRYRVDLGYEGHLDFAAEGAPARRLDLPGGRRPVQSASFTADETRAFVGKWPDVHVLDPADGTVLDTLTGVRSSSEQVVRPDGSHLAAAGTADSTGPSTIDLWRVDDGRLLMRCRPKGHYYVSHLAWSPDGRTLAASLIESRHGYGGTVHLFEPGPPVTVPEAERPSEDELHARLDCTNRPEDVLFLTGMRADLEDDPARRAGAWRAAGKRLADWDTPPPAAAEAYRRAIEEGTGPGAVGDGIALSRLMYAQRDLDGAVTAARDAHRRAERLGTDDRSRRLRFVAAVRLADMTRTRGGDGDLDEAEAAYRVCLDLRPDDPWSLLGLGWVESERGDAAAARPHLLRAVDAGDVKTEGYAAMLLGAPAKAARDLGEALRWYERAYTADDRHAPLAMGHLGELHHWLGERDGARRWYERMLEVTDLPDWSPRRAAGSGRWPPRTATPPARPGTSSGPPKRATRRSPGGPASCSTGCPGSDRFRANFRGTDGIEEGEGG